ALVLLTPTGFVTLFEALKGSKTATPQQQRARRFVLLAILFPFTVYFLFSLRHEVKLDWTGTVWIAAVPALAFAARQRGIRTAWAITLAVMLVLYGVGLDYLVSGLPGVAYSEHMEVVPVGW